MYNYSRVLARPKRQGTAPCRFIQRPVVFPQRPVVFFSALSFSKSPLVSLGFHQRYFELEVAESVQLRRKVARFLCIKLLFASDIATILDLLWILRWILYKLVRPVVFQDQLEHCYSILWTESKIQNLSFPCHRPSFQTLWEFQQLLQSNPHKWTPVWGPGHFFKN